MLSRSNLHSLKSRTTRYVYIPTWYYVITPDLLTNMAVVGVVLNVKPFWKYYFPVLAR